MTTTTPDIGARFDPSAASDGGAASADAGADRLASGGAGVDLGAPVSFRWRGRALTGVAGDTISSALLANGVRIVGRSFKYHRPRGVTSAGVEEAGALVTVGEDAERTPNVNASTHPLTEGLVVEPQNAWPSVDVDMMALNGVVDRALGPVFAAGFYYKTFFSARPWGSRGTGDWMLFEKIIRRAAGLGTLSAAPDPGVYETAHDHADVLVVGSGPAGLAAARVLAEAGADVVLAEQDGAIGGRLLSDGGRIEGAGMLAWRDAEAAAARAAGARILPSACVFGLYDGGVAGIVERPASGPVRERLRLVRVGRVVLAAGAIERGLAFVDNDRPGVMSASALRSYVNRFGVAAGRRVAVFGADDGAFEGLEALEAAGASVTRLDLRTAENASERADHVSVAPAAVSGGRSVAAVTPARERDGVWAIEDAPIPADLVAVSAGWRPTLDLLAQRGVALEWDEAQGAFAAPESQKSRTRPDNEPDIAVCGAAAGLAAPDLCAESGRAAAARVLGRDAPGPEAAERAGRRVYEVAVPRISGKKFVDLIHDVTADDVRLAAQEGFASVEHLKRYTTLGMATDQGKTSNVLGLAIHAEALGRDMAEFGATGFRPPYTPVSIGALAAERGGRGYKPERRTPLHDWNLARGAVMTDAGLWRRPWYFPKSAETLDEAYVREAETVRRTVGLCDVSTLGKILLQGPDAGAFLNRVYVNGFGKLPVGRARYGVMLRDDGLVLDDGTVWRLSDADFLVTTTTTGAGKVMSWLEKLAQTRFPELNVTMSSVSDAYAGLAVAGPLARRTLAHVFAAVDFSDGAFPRMGVRGARFGAAEALLARLSFSGELAYEVMVPSEFGPALADALWDVAEPMGGVLYGTEALGTLRIEKGHVAGPELDGRTTLADIGLAKMASSKKSFLGQALAQRPETAASDRQRLVGLEAVAPKGVFKAGSILRRSREDAGHGVGWVSSVTHSPALGRWIGLGFIEGGLEAWEGSEIRASDPVRDADVRVRVVSPHFVDPQNERLAPAEDPPAPAALGGVRPATHPRRISALGALYGADGAAARPASYGRERVDALEDPAAARGDGPVWLVEGAPERLLRVAAAPGGRAAVETALGLAAPLGFGSAGESRRGGRVMRLGPLEWWWAGGPAAPPIAPEIGAAADASPGWARVRVGGDAARGLVNRFLSLDLRDRAFAVGAAARADFAGVGVILDRVAPQAYDLRVPRSYAADFWERLETAARRMS